MGITIGQIVAAERVRADGAVLDCGPDVTCVTAPGRLTVVVAAGHRPRGSAVRDAERLVWCKHFPPDVDLTTPTVVYVCLPEGWLFLGPVRLLSTERRDGRLQRVELMFEKMLSDELLDRVRPTPLAPEPPDMSWLDLLPGDPRAAMAQFVSDWFPETETTDPVAVEPAVLSRFQDRASMFLHPISRIVRDRPDGLVVFGQESDGVFDMLFDPDDPDSAVYYEGRGDDLLQERESVPGFLMLFVLSRAVSDGPYGGFAFADAEKVRRVVAPLRQVPLRPLRFPVPRTETYAGPGIVVQTGPTEDDADMFEIYVGARNPAYLRPLRDVGLIWTYLSV